MGRSLEAAPRRTGAGSRAGPRRGGGAGSGRRVLCEKGRGQGTPVLGSEVAREPGVGPEPGGGAGRRYLGVRRGPGGGPSARRLVLGAGSRAPDSHPKSFAVSGRWAELSAPITSSAVSAALLLGRPCTGGVEWLRHTPKRNGTSVRVSGPPGRSSGVTGEPWVPRKVGLMAPVSPHPFCQDQTLESEPFHTRLYRRRLGDLIKVPPTPQVPSA